MPDKNANKVETGETAADAGQETAAEAPEEAAAETPETDEPMPGLAEQVEAEVVAQLEAECMQLKDRLLRALAESENMRRRAERDRKDAETYGGTRLARDVLAVHDNLARALSHVDDALRDRAKGFIEGVELTQRELLNAFAKHRIEKVSPSVGDKFDPNRHQAMFEAPVPGAQPGAVIQVKQAGFTIARRLLRPALVGVAKAVREAAPEPDEPDRAPADTEGE